jgi:hypothetical protein
MALSIPRWALSAGDAPATDGAYDLAALGYCEREFLISGRAECFTFTSESVTSHQPSASWLPVTPGTPRGS